jgi:Polyketide cyclase / dehydrase and lipid transport
MATSHWHKLYTAAVAASPKTLFWLLADMPGYGRWLPRSDAFAETIDVEPYPVQLGSRYHDGKPQEPGNDWRGTVTGFQPPGSLDFQQTIRIRQLRATIDVNIHYALEPEQDDTRVTRWQVCDIRMPVLFRPLRRAIIAAIDKENVRMMAAIKAYAEAHPAEKLESKPARQRS